MRKYPYIRDLLTWDLWCEMFTDFSINLDYDLHSTKLEDGSGLSQVHIDVIDRNTKKVVEAAIEVTNPRFKVIKDLKPQFDLGMENFKKYYQNLWD